jgi:hypothetical protein
VVNRTYTGPRTNARLVSAGDEDGNFAATPDSVGASSGIDEGGSSSPTRTAGNGT